VLDLPQVYQRPSFNILMAVLELLDLPPSSFSATDPDTVIIHPEGVTAYLTKLVASPLSWLTSDTERDSIWETSSHRLAQRSGRTGMSSLTRSFTIPPLSTSPTASSIEITLHEPALTEDNLGLKTWSSSYVLARLLPILTSIPLPLPSASPVLELGAGTGLVGLAAAAVWNANVVLTDLPAIVPNLARNVAANAEVLHSHGGHAEAGVLDWTDAESLAPVPSPTPIPTSTSPTTTTTTTATTPNAIASLRASAKTTTILAADPIYSPSHPRLLVSAVSRWLEDRGDAAASARLVLAYPVREAYLPQTADLRERLSEVGGKGLRVLEEGEEVGRDDWDEDVRVRWSVWGWK